MLGPISVSMGNGIAGKITYKIFILIGLKRLLECGEDGSLDRNSS